MDPPKEEAKAELHTYRVTFQKVQAFIEATGSLQAGIEGAAKILSPLPGSVEAISVKIGDVVKKGTPLVVIRSSDVSDTYANYISTLSQLKQSERIYNLNKELFEVGTVTKNDLLNSQASYEQAKALSEGLKKKLDIYGASSGEVSPDRLIIKAPIDGTVADIQAHIGDRFDTNAPLMIIANPKKILVVANIYDTDIVKIQEGKEVTFYVDVFPDVQFKGVIFYISDVEDADSKTIKTYIRILNATELCKQNMFLKIKILQGERILPIVPKTAIIYKKKKFYVKLKDGGRFTEKEITPVRDASETLMAVEGLKDGDEILHSAMEMETP
ncbi:MAG: efflux RND transporter periplasmic adaptor subunit [Nitrospirae bacterium]|nr:efflux RND transporter periplasmic adaptor subunit [Nitrospirota bacterium]MBF0591053.1 efflux RND transporter periplasmic adaptor subunit [Nitrospirota bacterium]